MKSFISRCLPLLLVSLLTSTAFNVAHAADDELPVDDLVSAFRNLDQSISRRQLQQAESQLAGLRQRAAGDTRLEQYQRQLAENHLQQGQTALQNGDLNGASASLGKARGLDAHDRAGSDRPEERFRALARIDRGERSFRDVLFGQLPQQRDDFGRNPGWRVCE